MWVWRDLHPQASQGIGFKDRRVYSFRHIPVEMLFANRPLARCSLAGSRRVRGRSYFRPGYGEQIAGADSSPHDVPPALMVFHRAM